jgi:hypothetical protein
MAGLCAVHSARRVGTDRDKASPVPVARRAAEPTIRCTSEPMAYRG